MDKITEYLLAAGGVVFMLTTGILGWAIKIIRANIVQDVADNTQLAKQALRETKDIRENYIGRFERLNAAVNGGHERIMERIGTLELRMTERYATKEELRDCKFDSTGKPPHQ